MLDEYGRKAVFAVMSRARELADWPIQQLREHLNGFMCDEQPSANQAREQYRTHSRGDLIEEILGYEFSNELD